MTTTNHLEFEHHHFPGIRSAMVLASEATRLVRDENLRDDQWQKADQTPVTIADLASQAILCRAIASTAPGDRVLAEEDTVDLTDNSRISRIREILEEITCESFSEGEITNLIGYRGAEKSDAHWLIDPLDGTKGYIRNLVYAVAMARIENGKPVAGWLSLPGEHDQLAGISNQLFSAFAGKGTMSSELKKPEILKSVQTEPGFPAPPLLVTGSRAHGGSQLPDPVIRSGIEVENLPVDSQAKYAAVATGKVHLYPRRHSRSFGYNFSWDHAAGALIVEEAGGIVTDLYGRKLDFSTDERLKNNCGILAASNRLIHDRFLPYFKSSAGKMA